MLEFPRIDGRNNNNNNNNNNNIRMSYRQRLWALANDDILTRMLRNDTVSVQGQNGIE
jgi:hypothetical protein